MISPGIWNHDHPGCTGKSVVNILLLTFGIFVLFSLIRRRCWQEQLELEGMSYESYSTHSSICIDNQLEFRNNL